MIIPFEKKVHVTVWMLANKTSFREVANLFKMEKSSVSHCFHEVCELLTNCRNDFISWPSREEQLKTARNVNTKYHFPNCVGFVDGCHIQIKAPPNNPVDFYNRKEVHSIVLQAVCDENLKFIDVYVGQTGRAHDSRVFRESRLFDQITNLVEKSYHILGDSAYTLKMNLLTPYRDNGYLTQEEIQYNCTHAKARSCIERAFGLLKSKFRRLKYLEMTKTQNIPIVICAACVLHNFIIINESPSNENNFNEDLNLEIFEANSAREKRDMVKHFISTN